MIFLIYKSIFITWLSSGTLKIFKFTIHYFFILSTGINYFIMKVLITGSSGSLGRLLTNFLIARNIDVVGLDIKESEDHFTEKQFRFYRCSITEKDKLKSIFSQEQPTNVVHLACSFNKIRVRHREYEVDIGGSTNVLGASINTLSVKQLIYSSSAAVYGGHNDNKALLKESDQLRPGQYRYGINKKLIEETLLGTPVRNDLHIISLRICSVIGPSYDKPKSVVSILIKLPFLPKFCMENKIQFLHSDDMISLIGLILEDKEINGVFNLAPDSYAIVKELVPGKKFVAIPLFMMTGILYILWNLKILNLQPAAIKASIYPMILDPSMIITRYGYKFKFSSEEAFNVTLHKNKIPLNARF